MLAPHKTSLWSAFAIFAAFFVIASVGTAEEVNDHYSVLGVSRDASLSEIEDAYIAQGLHHRQNPKMLKTLKEAFETLRNRSARDFHDAKLEEQEAARQAAFARDEKVLRSLLYDVNQIGGYNPLTPVRPLDQYESLFKQKETFVDKWLRKKQITQVLVNGVALASMAIPLSVATTLSITFPHFDVVAPSLFLGPLLSFAGHQILWRETKFSGIFAQSIDELSSWERKFSRLSDPLKARAVIHQCRALVSRISERHPDSTVSTQVRLPL